MDGQTDGTLPGTHARNTKTHRKLKPSKPGNTDSSAPLRYRYGTALPWPPGPDTSHRLLRSLACVFVIFLGLSVFANDIYALVAGPLLAQLPEQSSMIATEVAAPFLVPFKLTFFVAVLVSVPYLLYQAWAFVAPGLYQKNGAWSCP